MEALRYGLLEQQQRFARTVYEGRAPEFLEGNQSLPPPPDKPVDARTGQPAEQHAEQHAESVAGEWKKPIKPKKYSPEQLEQVRTLLNQGLNLREVAEATGVIMSSVKYLKNALGLARPRKRAPVRISAFAESGTPDELAAYRARGGRAAVANKVKTAPAPVPVQARPPVEQPVPEAPAPAVRASTACTRVHEPVRPDYLLDWAAKMDAYEYSNAPAGVIPVKRRSRSMSGTADFRQVYPWPYVRDSSSINSHQQKPQPRTVLHTRPHVLAQSVAAAFQHFA